MEIESSRLGASPSVPYRLTQSTVFHPEGLVCARSQDSKRPKDDWPLYFVAVGAWLGRLRFSCILGPTTTVVLDREKNREGAPQRVRGLHCAETSLCGNAVTSARARRCICA